MNDEKLVFGNYSYILEKLAFLSKFCISVSILNLVENKHETWIKFSEIHINLFPCEWKLQL